MDTDELIDREAAIEIVRRSRDASLDGLGVESVSIDRIGGRTLAQEVIAEEDNPRHSHATMDGYAFDATGGYPYRIVDKVFPEDDPPSIGVDQAVRIATGAPLPPEANAVLKQEEASVDGDRLDGQPIEPGTYVYEQGSNVNAGERLFERGDRLAPKDAIVLRDIGRETVDVFRQLSVGILATGSEIHEGVSADLDSPMLAGLVRSWGHEPTYEGTVPDEYDRVHERIDTLAEEYDVLLTTGGTSVGHKDYVVRVLADLGDISFHGVKIRPGKPIAHAVLPDHDAIVFAIPGKPIGAHTIATAICRPFFTGSELTPSIEATFAVDVDIETPGFEYWIPVTFDGPTDSTSPFVKAMPLGHAESDCQVYDRAFDPSVISSTTRVATADGFVVSKTAISSGDVVDVIPYSAIT